MTSLDPGSPCAFLPDSFAELLLIVTRLSFLASSSSSLSRHLFLPCHSQATVQLRRPADTFKSEAAFLSSHFAVLWREIRLRKHKRKEQARHAAPILSFPLFLLRLLRLLSSCSRVLKKIATGSEVQLQKNNATDTQSLPLALTLVLCLNQLDLLTRYALQPSLHVLLITSAPDSREGLRVSCRGSRSPSSSPRRLKDRKHTHARTHTGGRRVRSRAVTQSGSSGRRSRQLTARANEQT